MDPKLTQQAIEEKVREETAMRAVIEVAKMEKQLDQTIEALDNISESDLQKMRQKRLMELKGKELRKKGHGTYTEVADQKAWFEEVKSSDRVVTHFYRPSTWRCNIVDKHLLALAPKHVETKFIKIDAEKSPFLCERLNVTVLPTLIMTKGGFTHDRLVGFDELGGKDTFTTEALERRLGKKNTLDYEERPVDPNRKPGTRENPTGAAIYKSRLQAMLHEDIDDEELEDDSVDKELQTILSAKDSQPATGAAAGTNASSAQ